MFYTGFEANFWECVAGCEKQRQPGDSGARAGHALQPTDHETTRGRNLFSFTKQSIVVIAKGPNSQPLNLKDVYYYQC
jgi:hypothetical protein